MHVPQELRVQLYQLRNIQLEFLDLPDDVLFLIIDLLHLETRIQLWNTCHQLRIVLQRRETIMRVTYNFPWRLMPTLQYDYLMTMSKNLQELTLKHVQLPTSAIEDILKLEALRFLDVRYTGLPIAGVSRICRDITTIRSLAADFNVPAAEITMNHLLTICRGFKHLHELNLRELTSYRMTQNGSDKYPYFLLFSCNVLVNLTLTDVRIHGESLSKDIFDLHNCRKNSKVKVFSLHTDPQSSNYNEVFDIVKNICDDTWQFALIEYTSAKPSLYVTKLLYDEVKKQVNSLQCRLVRTGESMRCNPAVPISFYMWKLCLTDNKPTMYHDIIREINKCFPVEVCGKTGMTSRTSCVLGTCTWISTPIRHVRQLYKEKKLRFSQPEIDINIHRYVDSKTLLKITYASLNCGCESDISCYTIIQSNIPVLVNIVELRMLDVNVSVRFYGLLFKYCQRLQTFHIRCQAPGIRYSALLGKLTLCKSLKNFSLIAGGVIDVMAVLVALSSVPSITKIAICNTNALGWSVPARHDLTVNSNVISELINNCSRLRSLAMFVLQRKNTYESNRNEIRHYYKQIAQIAKTNGSLCNKQLNVLYEDSNHVLIQQVFNDDVLDTYFGNEKCKHLNKSINLSMCREAAS